MVALRWLAMLLVTAAPARAAEEPRLVDPSGVEVAVEAPAAGQLVLLHFWATWCPSCAEDLAILEQASASCPAPRLRVLAVNVGESEQEATRFAVAHGIGLPVWRDPRGRLWREVDGRGLPANFFWTETGRTTDVGPKSLAQWRERLAPFDCG